MEYKKLENGLQLPVLGFGVYQISNSEEAIQSVKTAIKSGYRHIDTAAVYMNEREVGQAIKESEVPREDLFITSKLWVQDAGYENAKKAFYRTLERLNLDYLDLYLIHQPYSDVHGSWRALEELYEEGKIKAIGVSNFSPDRLMDLISYNKIKPMVNQIEVNVFNQQHDAVEFNKAQNVITQAWSPFAQGIKDIFKNEKLQKIGDKYNKSIAQVMTKWLLQRDIAIVAKSVKQERMKENLDVFDFELSPEDINVIETFDLKESQIVNHKDPERVKTISQNKFDI
ncbi:aldo/keto reductase [Staphylococcus saprophyticus]|uniref:aldo/keto reductase n=1 Tax=Staphylococcus saprophyticus TaxID=29385 RepID=UPI0019D0AD4C|nr:aldo/keto reductase [Staphylococcus saprophyticus]